MTRRRFYAPPDHFNNRQQTVSLAEDEARYLREVLRLKPGADVFVFDGAGKEYQCVVEQSRRDSALLKIISEVSPSRPESPLKVTLGVALLKGEKFDLVVQKATELGVNQIVPLITRQADIRLRDEADAKKRVTRWQRIALEAAKQSGRTAVPHVDSPQAFDEFVRGESSNGVHIIFTERGGESFELACQNTPEKADEMVAVVGPEGGWAEEEIALAREAGWLLVTLQGRILRAETAAIAVAALIQHRFGDLR